MAQYTPKTWTTGETILATELNAIEQAAAAAAVKADLATVATSGSYTDLTNKPSIPAAYTDEQAQDAVAAAFAAGTQTGVTVAYNDAANSLSITATGSTSPNATTTSPGIVQLAGDLAGTATAPTVPGLASKLDKATADGLYVSQANAIDLESTQDSIAGMFTGGTHSGISFAYNDPGNVINATVTPGAVADATTTAKGAVQLAGDLAGTAAAPTVTGGTHHGHTAAQVTGLATVATSGAYADLSGKPTIPTNTVASTTVTTIVTLTAAAYTALGTKDSATLYVVTP